MKGLLLEFIFLTLLADIFFLGSLLPWLKRRYGKKREVDIENARTTRKHLITFWNDHGNGWRDDSYGWRCSCGLFVVGDRGIDEHLDFIREIESANAKIQELE